jgi:DNA polymerase-3 subunit delta
LLKSQDVTFENDKLLDEFENLVSLDPFMIENELNKLILATDHKIITKSILEKAISSSTELNIFKLTTYLLLRNKELLINLYDNLITLKYQPVELIQIMASQLFNLKLLKQATLEHYSQTDIENGLKITKFMQFANRDILSKVTINQLDQVINELTLLDYNVKHNLANPYLGLKLILSK